MHNERLARAALSRLMEPQDAAGLALVHVAGAEDALRIATGQVGYGPGLEQDITVLLAEQFGEPVGWPWCRTAALGTQDSGPRS